MPERQDCFTIFSFSEGPEEHPRGKGEADVMRFKSSTGHSLRDTYIVTQRPAH